VFFGGLLVPYNNQYNNELSKIIFNDGIIISSILLITIVIYSLFIYKKYQIKYFYIAISCIVLFDYYRIDNEIIKPDNHYAHKEIIKPKKYIDKFLYKDELVKFLLNDSSKYRIVDFVNNQNRWSVYNIENISGYHPAKLNNYNDFLININKKGYQLWPPGILKLLNIKYLVLPGPIINNDLFENLGQKNTYFFGNHNIYDGKEISISLYKYNDSYNRLFYTNSIKRVDTNDIYNHVISDIYDPSDIVYTTNHDIDYENFSDKDRSVILTKWTSDEIYFSTKSSTNQFLVISDVYYEDGWKIYNNNEECKIYEINNLVRGISIPKGENNFKMIFNPKEVTIGKFLTSFGYIMIFFMIIFYCIKKNKNETI
tara:strand:- start:106 stop:1215 length:1110 start_codon:yes stop_codon:yes gene_type:complete